MSSDSLVIHPLIGHPMMVAFPAGIAFVVAWWMTNRLCSPKSFLAIHAHPNERTLHSQPTPQTGGLAIIAGVVLSLLATASVFVMMEPSKTLLPKGLASGSLWIMVSMLLIFVVSFIDDCVGLPAILRLGVQAASALIIIDGVGVTLPSIPIPSLAIVQFGWTAIPVSALILIWMTNLYNFMDGMDGFSGGMTAIGFGFLAYFGWEAESPVMFLISSIIAMSALGFLAYNFPPARIFMGDAGSITIGFLCGTLMILGVRDRMYDVWVPVIIFSPFILDATITLIRRALRCEKLWLAHREHYYQRLVLSGWSHRDAVLVEYGVMLLCGGLAVLYHHATEGWQLGILIFWLVSFLAMGIVVNYLEQRIRRKEPECSVVTPPS